MFLSYLSLDRSVSEQLGILLWSQPGDARDKPGPSYQGWYRNLRFLKGIFWLKLFWRKYKLTSPDGEKLWKMFGRMCLDNSLFTILVEWAGPASSHWPTPPRYYISINNIKIGINIVNNTKIVINIGNINTNKPQAKTKRWYRCDDIMKDRTSDQTVLRRI